MTSPAITSLALDDHGDLFTEVGANGRTIVLAHNHEVVSNLFQLRLKTEINWQLFADNPDIDPAILQQKARTVGKTTYAVTSVDLSQFKFTINNRNADYGTICFSVDCANSKETIEI